MSAIQRNSDHAFQGSLGKLFLRIGFLSQVSLELSDRFFEAGLRLELSRSLVFNDELTVERVFDSANRVDWLYLERLTPGPSNGQIVASTPTIKSISVAPE